jgi:hypothetical protein
MKRGLLRKYDAALLSNILNSEIDQIFMRFAITILLAAIFLQTFISNISKQCPHASL